MANVFTARILKNTEIESTFTGNGATEETVHEILKLMEDSALFKKGASATTPHQRKKEEVAKKEEEVVKKQGIVAKAMSKVFDSSTFINPADRIRLFGGLVSDVTMSLTRLDTNISSLSGTIAGMSGTASGFITSLGSMAGGWTHTMSQVIGNVIRVGGTFSGFAVDTIAKFSEINRTLATANIQFENGIDEMISISERAGFPIREFSSYLEAAAPQLRLFAGGAADGAKMISEGFRTFREANNEQYEHLFRIGYQADEIVGAMAEYGARAQLAGRQLDAESLAQGTYEYLVNLRELSRITGVSVQEARDQMIQDQSNLFVQRQLLQANENVRDELSQFIGVVPEGVKVMRDYIMAGNNFNEQSAMLTTQLPTFARAYRDAYQQIESGAMTAEEAMEYLSRNLEGDSDQIQREINRMINTFGIAPAELIQFADQLGPAGKVVREMVEASSSAGNAFKNMDEDTSATQEAIGKLPVVLQETVSILDNTFNEAVSRSAGLINDVTEISLENARNLQNKFREQLDKLDAQGKFELDLETVMGFPIVSQVGSVWSGLPAFAKTGLKWAAAGLMLAGPKGAAAGFIAGSIYNLGWHDPIRTLMGIEPEEDEGAMAYAMPAAIAGLLAGGPKGAVAGYLGGYAYYYSKEALRSYLDGPELTEDMRSALGADDDTEYTPMQRRHMTSRYNRSLAEMEEWANKSEEERRRRIMLLESRIREQLEIDPDASIDDIKAGIMVPRMRSTSPMPDEVVRDILENFIQEQNIGPQSSIEPDEFKRYLEKNNEAIGNFNRLAASITTELREVKAEISEGNRKAGNYYSATA